LKAIIGLLIATIVGMAAVDSRAPIVRSDAEEFNELPHSSMVGDLWVPSAGSAVITRAFGEEPKLEKNAIGIVPDHSAIRELLYTPTSPQWRRPGASIPSATIIGAALENDDGEVRYHTVLHTRHDLPVVSLITSQGALINEDSGLYVMGNAVVTGSGDVVERYHRDQRWWKYPGNYQFRGKEWERAGVLEVFNAQMAGLGTGYWPVKWRINGNNTRGFPLKAIRIYFPDDKEGRTRVILRGAGNDYDRMFMRDALQHQLCDGLSFDVMDSEPVVLYINGAYWGIHYVRPRMDDVELANRYGLKRNAITILEDMVEFYRGERSETRRFWEMIRSLEDSQSDLIQLERVAEQHLDVQNFLEYMAAQIILANKDWPFQNLKYWCYSGPIVASVPESDGRWRFIMGDSDLAFGYEGPDMATYDMFEHVQRNGGAIARLFKALMQSPGLKSRFVAVVEDMSSGPLSTDVMVQGIIDLSAKLESEMTSHIVRWRRPSNIGSWKESIDQGMKFASERSANVKRHLEEFKQGYPEVN
jgi:hypothetical protein